MPFWVNTTTPALRRPESGSLKGPLGRSLTLDGVPEARRTMSRSLASLRC